MKTLKAKLGIFALLLTLFAAPVTTEAQVTSNFTDFRVTPQDLLMIKIPQEAQQNQLTLINEQGSVVFQVQNLEAARIHEFDLSSFTAGAYVLQLAYLDERTRMPVLASADFILN